MSAFNDYLRESGTDPAAFRDHVRGEAPPRRSRPAPSVKALAVAGRRRRMTRAELAECLGLSESEAAAVPGTRL